MAASKRPRRTPRQGAADRASAELSKKLGRQLRDARKSARKLQREVALRAGLSRSEWSELERGANATVATWNRAAFAVGSSLDSYLKGATATDEPRDAVHLRHQELVIRTAPPGGWRQLPEEPIDRQAHTSRSADVLLHRPRTRPSPTSTRWPRSGTGFPMSAPPRATGTAAWLHSSSTRSRA